MKVDFNNTKVAHSCLLNSKISFPKELSVKPIYHYTSIGGVEGILSSNKLRFTNIKYMNDKDELKAGVESVAKEWELSGDARKKLFSAFMNADEQTFICCFSLEDDSLAMWNYYTKEVNNQGYNIEFDVLKLVESILRENPELEGCDLGFGEVDYSNDNDSEYSKTVRHAISTAIEILMPRLLRAVTHMSEERKISGIEDDALKIWEEKASVLEKEAKPKGLPVFFYNGSECNFLKAPAGNYLYFIKRDCFIHEKEFRIAISVPKEVIPKLAEKNVYKFRVSNGVLVPYIELKFSRDAVKSVAISPTVQSDLVELSMRDFLSYCNYDIGEFSQFIRRSKVPVRF